MLVENPVPFPPVLAGIEGIANVLLNVACLHQKWTSLSPPSLFLYRNRGILNEKQPAFGRNLEPLRLAGFRRPPNFPLISFLRLSFESSTRFFPHPLAISSLTPYPRTISCSSPLPAPGPLETSQPLSLRFK